MIKGLNIGNLPFNNLSFVGNLLFKEYPSTVVYSDVNKSPFILEWVDVSETGLDKYFLYETSIDNLKRYLEKEISHYNLILEAKGGVAVFYDGSIEQPQNISVINIEFIDEDYLPSANTLFNKEDSEDLEEIYSYFSLRNYVVKDELKLNVAVERPIEYHSLKKNSELFRIHLNNNKYVGHGNAQTDVLGNTLIGFEDVYHELAIDSVQGKDRIIKLNKKNKDAFESISNTEVVIREAASFSIYIRPKVSQIELNTSLDPNEPAQITTGETIFRSVLEVIHNTSTSDLIDSVKDKYNPAVFSKLKIFAEHIKKHDLVVDLDYYSPISAKKLTEKVDVVSANNILTTMAVTSISNNDTIHVIAKFEALHCKTGHFTITTNDEIEYTGYFDKKIRESMPTLNFIDLYTITIEVSQVKNIADSDFKTENIIVATVKKETT